MLGSVRNIVGWIEWLERNGYSYSVISVATESKRAFVHVFLPAHAESWYSFKAGEFWGYHYMVYGLKYSSISVDHHPIAVTTEECHAELDSGH